ncbi:hypothetical protein, partial [Siminovitchia sp. 179-K 8D1 HS]|uniref:hypothetical protein n=1 Tax=Siminovitchia sp. 179-K 8D1 HS TaxID=3142385 RepID=UPI0039A3CD2A
FRFVQFSKSKLGVSLLGDFYIISIWQDDVNNFFIFFVADHLVQTTILNITPFFQIGNRFFTLIL